MTVIYLPAYKPEDWQPHLGDPKKHWRTGYSAKALAYCWQEAEGFPREVQVVFRNSGTPFATLTPLIILPEHKVALPGRSTASQSDLWILAKSGNDLFSITVEGKVSESFNKSVSDWLFEDTKGKQTRLAFLIKTLGISDDFDRSIRYQLLHRTASAILEAERFLASHAMVIVHSFSPSDEWFEDYAKFVGLFGLTPKINSVVSAQAPFGLPLHFAWIHGDEKYLKK
jgi:hypothetical protein